MLGQHKARRMILGALVVMVAAATSLGSGHGARAGDNAVYEGNYGSDFKSFCKSAGGTYSEDGLGNSSCHYKDGGWTECDANGNDCWYTPPGRPAEPDDPFDPFDGGEGQVSDELGGSQPPAPVADSPTPSSTQPGVVAPDDDPDQDTGKSKKGKKGKKGGKGRK